MVASCWLLLASLDFRRHYANLVETRALRIIDCFRHVAIVKVRITLYEDHFRGSGLEDVRQASLEIGFLNWLSVDLHTLILFHLDHNGWILIRRRWRLVRWWRLRYQRIQTVWSQRCDDHENDQQHEQNIDKRRDIDVRPGSPGATDCHCHN